MPRSVHFAAALAVPFIVLTAADAVLADAAGETSTQQPVQQPVEQPVEFNRDIRPILSNHCFQCHGPDAENVQSGLRFDDETIAKGELESGLRAIVAGDLEASELVTRIHDEDEYVVMPPPETNKPLSDEQKELLERWIMQGAEYEDHWSLVPLAPLAEQTVPEAPAEARVANAIDAFVARRLASEGMRQSDRADARTLLRRLSFDLTGLPPTPEELAAFEADDSPQAYENAVDRLLDSPHYGEHMARFWLDLVRYADTHGMHFDNYREMWPYRDYVIDSFNQNKPLDEFYTEQLAGDLLGGEEGEPTRTQLVASGFNRLNVTTNEGGSIYEEVVARNVIDRTEAFGTVFVGLTTGCAVCHDHKFDPISQAEFYQLSAFFNSLDGQEMDQNVKDHQPSIKVPSEQQQTRLAELEQLERDTLAGLMGELPQADAGLEAWIASLRSPDESVESEPVPLNVTELHATADNTGEGISIQTVTPDGEQPLIEVTGENPARSDYTITATLPATGRGYRTLRLEVLPLENDRVGRTGGNAVISEVVVQMQQPDGTFADVGLRGATASYAQKGFDLQTLIDGKINDTDGWGLGGHEKTGGRTLWISFDGPIGETKGDSADEEPQPVTVRVIIKQQSKWGYHTIGKFRLAVDEAARRIEPVEMGDWHAAGPFELEARNAGFYRNLFGEADGGRKFPADRRQTYLGTEQTWKSPEEVIGTPLDDGVVATLPLIERRASAVIFHRTITSPVDQELPVFIDSADTVRVFLNGKEVFGQREPRPLQPYRDRIALKLKSGANQLYIKQVTDGTHPPQVMFAAASPVVAPTGRLADAMAQPADERSEADATALRRLYRTAISEDADVLAIRREAREAVKAREAYFAAVPTTLVWRETPQPREAHVLIRGEYDQLGEVVPRDTPAALPPFPEDASRDRLGLAQWLLQPGHPLTARVAANRFWQQVFGTGLVKTSEDFGGQGETPSHPQLLDYLSAELATDWNVKRLMKLMVMSETYRQSSDVSPDRLAADPRNRLLARGPRYRLDAESLRDQALAVSGLLNTEVGGPSVKPPQPKGLWKAVAFVGSNTAEFTPSDDDEIYRRSVYIFWKRTATAPMMATLDAPPRESCTARRERTNTPLQALLLMNEQLYVESARALADSVLRDLPDASDAARVAAAFERTTGRPITDAERSELEGLLLDVRDLIDADPEAATRLLGGRVPDTATESEQAAWTIVANTLLNLDEVVSKN